MPHRSFGTVRAGVEREPITFDFGTYGEETFTLVPDPTLGDTFDLHDAPEPNPTNELESVRILARFIRRMLSVDDRKRFDAALYRIPASQSYLIMECGEWIMAQLVPFPAPPPRISSGGRRSTGTTSKAKPAGKRP